MFKSEITDYHHNITLQNNFFPCCFDIFCLSLPINFLLICRNFRLQVFYLTFDAINCNFRNYLYVTFRLNKSPSISGLTLVVVLGEQDCGWTALVVSQVNRSPGTLSSVWSRNLGRIKVWYNQLFISECILVLQSC